MGNCALREADLGAVPKTDFPLSRVGSMQTLLEDWDLNNPGIAILMRYRVKNHLSNLTGNADKDLLRFGRCVFESEGKNLRGYFICRNPLTLDRP
jgi:hypothetical protein